MSEQRREPAFLWAGRPVYRCSHYPACKYERVENLEAVLMHEATGHAPVVRESRILGPEGERLLVAEHPVLPAAAAASPAPAKRGGGNRRKRS